MECDMYLAREGEHAQTREGIRIRCHGGLISMIADLGFAIKKR
jgi:hypothetical protein